MQKPGPAVAILAALLASTAAAQEGGGDADLAKKLSNPIASLISVPIQFNYDGGLGSADGDKAYTNIQPVIPFDLTEDVSLVMRAILPVVWQNDVAGRSGTQFGLGDTLNSFFFVPNPMETSLGTLTYGAGPAVTWPTSTDRLLGSGTFAMGPTGVFLFQNGPWTVGSLVGHQWKVVETRGNMPDVNNTFFQPFVSYTTPSAWTFGANFEGGYNWTRNELSLPVNLYVSKLTDIGGQKVQFELGTRYWLDAPSSGPEGFGVRAEVVFLFPK